MTAKQIQSGAGTRVQMLADQKWQPYEEYKDSGVEWLGMVPKHWKTIKLKFCCVLSNQKLLEKPEYLPYIGLENIESKTGRLFIDTQPEFVDSTVSVFRPGDVLFNKLRPYLAKVVAVDFSGACTTELLVFRPGNMVEAKYLFYRLLSEDFIELVNSFTYGTKMPRAGNEQIANIVIQIPSLPEQQRIATFLDNKTTHIDALIAKKEQHIVLLQEKRAALISHAVTKGLNPDVPMKDSGVEWLGMVPEHWEVRRLAMAVKKITNGYVGPTRDILVNEGVRYLQSLHIKGGTIKFDKPYYVTEKWSNEHGKSILKKGDVVIVQTGDVGQCCAIPEEFEGCNCHALIIVQLKDNLGSGFYLSAFLRSYYGKNTLQQAQTGALHPHLECGKVREIQILLPPPEEQEQILDFINHETQKIDALISTITEGIKKLQEYRTALISAAVTGKIDVRGTVAEEPGMVEGAAD